MTLYGAIIKSVLLDAAVGQNHQDDLENYKKNQTLSLLKVAIDL